MARDNTTEDAAIPRIRSQMPISDKVRFADKVLDNSGTLQELKEQVDRLLVKLHPEVRWTWFPCWICPPLGFVFGTWTLIWRNYLRKDKKKTALGRMRQIEPTKPRQSGVE